MTYLTLALTGIYFAFRALRAPEGRAFVLAGVFFGLAYLTRPEAVVYPLIVLGVTVGYHRLFTHKAFETNRVVQFILAALGSMAVQGPLLNWVALHRRHHQHSDEHEDPHSPHHQGAGLIGMLRGLWHAHLGWIFKPYSADLVRYVREVQAEKRQRADDEMIDPFDYQDQAGAKSS